MDHFQAQRFARKKETAMLRQVLATGDVAPQNTLKRTREAVSRWLISTEDGSCVLVSRRNLAVITESCEMRISQ